jgi:Phage tail protein
MAFLPYGSTVPTLTAWQMNFNNALSLGPGTNLELTGLEGIDMPAVRSGDAGRPRDHGAFAGLDVMGEREITVKADLHNRTGTFSEAWEECANATVPGGTIQYPLFFNTTTWGTLTTLARVRKRQMPVDITFTLGNLAKVTLLFAGTDPRWYGPTQQLSVKPPASVGGFTWPLKWPLKWGGGGYTGALSVTNAGNIETRPILTVEGPCVNPSIQNATAPGGPTLTFNLTLNAGEKLVIDTDMHTATLYSSGSTAGSTRTGDLVAGSKWWTLEEDTTSTIQFFGAEGTLYVEYASAWII